MNRRWLALLLSPLGLVLISAGRLLIISNYDATTATTIASSGGYVNTLLGSIIPLVPIFIPYVALLLLLFRQFLLSAFSFIFTAFIAPTSLILPVTRRMAAADEHQLLARIDANRTLTFTIAFLIFIIAYIHFHSFVEALATLLMLAVAVALLSAPAIQNLYLPSALSAANSSEHHIIPQYSHDMLALAPELPSGERWVVISTVIILVVIMIISNVVAIYTGWLWLPTVTRRGFAAVTRAIPDATTIVIAVLATAALFPYVYNMYPVPHRTEYYVGVLRSPWLPAEKFSLSSGRNYYGYALSTDTDWFVVLLSQSRKIIYIPTADILRRSACETLSQRQLPVEAPLITTFYASPPKIRDCADRKHLRIPSASTRTRPQSNHPG